MLQKVNQLKENESKVTPTIVDEMIKSIYVKEKDENTEELVIAAKKAWDSLSEEEKKEVEEFDYFGRNTGDAMSDNPRASAPTRDKEILVVSFGTSFNDNRLKAIGSIEGAIEREFGHEFDVRRAFTSRIIINHIASRDGIKINDVEESVLLAKKAGVKELVIQPTHLMHGEEYDKLVENVMSNKGEMKVIFGEPLLGPMETDKSKINQDKEEVLLELARATAKDAGVSNFQDLSEDTAVVYMGHGTSHEAMITYTQMQTACNKLGHSNVFVGTVDGEPKETALENVVEKVKDSEFKKVILRPMMVVAGDHANNDMAGDDEDSWKSVFEKEGIEVSCHVEGLGEIPGIQRMYINHIAAVI